MKLTITSQTMWNFKLVRAANLWMMHSGENNKCEQNHPYGGIFVGNHTFAQIFVCWFFTNETTFNFFSALFIRFTFSQGRTSWKMDDISRKHVNHVESYRGKKTMAFILSKSNENGCWYEIDVRARYLLIFQMCFAMPNAWWLYHCRIAWNETKQNKKQNETNPNAQVMNPGQSCCFCGAEIWLSVNAMVFHRRIWFSSSSHISMVDFCVTALAHFKCISQA